MTEDKEESYLELADWIEQRFSRTYARGVGYLRQLAGQTAMPQEQLPRLHFMHPNLAQRGAVRRVRLPNPLENDVHSLRVAFHRL